ncbi:DUF2130 domain-containing protein [Candidatus Beckwithbacteria bacterium]|nr:DUF2130 domain-containing protein [Candidatus Beckwithbacteria bacterium]
MPDQIKCPHCGEQITITEALTKHLQAESEVKFKKQIEALQNQIEANKEAMVQEKAELEKKLKAQLWSQAQEKAEEKMAEKYDLELKELKEKTSEDDKRKKEMEEQILAERKKMRELEEERRRERLELDKKLQQQRQKLEEEIGKQVGEQHRLKDLEKEKTINDLLKQLEEAKRRAQQGSQQNQGEVLELDLEKSLQENFPHDLIEPVGKGVSGADIIQTVHNNSGSLCGVILWESKRTKHWTEAWVSKFKDDLRAAKANIPVLVTTILPKDIEGFAKYKGIWVVTPVLAVQLAMALRQNLLAVAYERAISAGKGKKSELLFDYISSHEFRQKVEALVEVFSEMQTQVIKERVAFEKSWQQREKQIQRLMLNTAGMYGDLQGVVGSSMPEIKGLELGEENKQLKEKNQDQTLF